MNEYDPLLVAFALRRFATPALALDPEFVVVSRHTCDVAAGILEKLPRPLAPCDRDAEAAETAFRC